MKTKRTETDNKKNTKDKKGKKVTLNLNEDKKVNTYEQYRIEKIDLISQSSEDDIEAKMKKLIEIKRKGGNIEEYNENEINKIKFTKNPLINQFIPKKENENNKQQEDKNNLIKIKNGLISFMKYLSLKKTKIKKNAFLDLKLYNKQSKEKGINKDNNLKKKLILNIDNSEGEEEEKNYIKENKNKIINTNIKEDNIVSLINTIKNLLLKEKMIFFNNIIRRKTKKKTVKMGFSKKGFRRPSNSRHQTSKFEPNQKEMIGELEEEELPVDIDESNAEDTFIQMDRLGDIEKDKVDKSQLVEYDAFYKEQFFKNELFNYDVEDIKDKEVEEINHEMNKLEAHRKLVAKRKEKDAQEKKGLNTTELQQQIEVLEKEYIKAKTKEKPKLNLIMNNTEGLLYKGRLLGFYFNGIKKPDFPKFSLESSKETGAKEIIDFKDLRKEEKARRYFDYHCCLEQRQKIYKGLVYARFYCRFLVDNMIFDNLSLLVIIVNTILILISDPTDAKNIGNLSDNYFLYFYTLEAILKIISFTFFFS